MPHKLLPKPAFNEIESLVWKASRRFPNLVQIVERYEANERYCLEGRLSGQMTSIEVRQIESRQAQIESDLSEAIKLLKPIFDELSTLVETEKEPRRYEQVTSALSGDSVVTKDGQASHP